MAWYGWGETLNEEKICKWIAKNAAKIERVTIDHGESSVTVYLAGSGYKFCCDESAALAEMFRYACKCMAQGTQLR